MSSRMRPGIGAARSLLGFVEDHSVQELEAAETILGNEEDLVELLRMVRRYKEKQEPPERSPLSVELLREIVRRELLDLQIPVNAMASAVSQILHGPPIRTPPGTTTEEVVDRALKLIENRSDSPPEAVDRLVALLSASFRRAGPEHEARLWPMLRDLATQALAENVVIFPTMEDLAGVRTLWADKPLPRAPRESRRHLAARLFIDLERLAPEHLLGIAQDLLREGLRGPADAEIARVRRMDRKKAHGE